MTLLEISPARVRPRTNEGHPALDSLAGAPDLVPFTPSAVADAIVVGIA